MNKKKNKKRKINTNHKYDHEKNNCIKSNNSDSNDFSIPIEIDTHYSLYGKHVWEVIYHDKCPICGCNVDEYGFCGCGSGSE
ncbi:MAG: hypothetical protein ACPKQO_03115 [Nitrososphaeraceae archaeon]